MSNIAKLLSEQLTDTWKDAQGLPVGVMLTAPRFGEERLIAVAEALKG